MAKRRQRISPQEFQQRKGFYVQGQASQAQQVDKAVLTLGSGAFGVSLAFIRDIAGDDVQCVWLLALSWLTLLGSVASVIVSLRFGADAHAFEDAELEKQRCDPNYELAENVCANRISLLNWAAIGLLVIGAVLLASFALVNITSSRGNRMSTHATNRTDLTEGYTPPARAAANPGGDRGTKPPARPVAKPPVANPPKGK